MFCVEREKERGMDVCVWGRGRGGGGDTNAVPAHDRNVVPNLSLH
jgi:hypothetical protein